MGHIGIKNITLDVAKGITITLVVSFHVLITNTGNWAAFSHSWYIAALNLFVLPLFIFISGYLTHLKTGFRMIQHRSQQLIPPYIVWTIILFFFSGFVATGFLLKSNLIKTLLYDLWSLNLSSFWFLPLILALCLILYLTRGKPWGMLIAFFTVYGLSQISWRASIHNMHIPETAWFSTLAWYMPFFTGGHLISKYRAKLHPLRYFKWFCLAAFPVFFILGGKMNDTTFSYSWPGIFSTGWDVISGFYRFGMTILGIGIVFSLASLFSRVAVIRRLFQHLGGITLGIYCSHPLFLTLGVGSGIFRVLLAIIIVISLSTALVWLLRKSRITKYLFLGSGQKLFSKKKIVMPDKPTISNIVKDLKPN